MKKVSLLLILVLSTISISAQESGVSDQAGRKTTFTQTGFWNNWFIGAGAGANMYFGAEDAHADFLKRPTLTGNLQVGKWFNPYVGARLKGTYGKIHTFENDAAIMHRQKAITGEVDLMFNVNNYFGKYNERRVYSFIPYIGIGGAYGNGYTRPSNRSHEKTLTFNAGIINSFRLTERLALELEVSGTLLKKDYDRRNYGTRAYDILGNASANLVYKIGKVGFSEARLMDAGELDRLNGEINKLKQENDLLLRRPKDCPKCPEVAPAEKIVEVAKESGLGANAVFFRIGSTTIDKTQEANIFEVAQYLKSNPGSKVEVTGYADKDTGSKTFNQRISEKRAKKVADTLIKKYNIDSNRVKVSWKGDKDQPYAKQNAWNRVVIMAD